MKNINVILILLMVMLGVTKVSAQRKCHKERQNPEKVFNQLDINKDGKISKEEAEKAPRKHLFANFDEIDSNADGFINKSEVKKMRENKKKRLKDADTNNDGNISIDEMLALKKKRLIKADKNKNGFLEPEELDAMRHHHKGNHHKKYHNNHDYQKCKGELHHKKCCNK